MGELDGRCRRFPVTESEAACSARRSRSRQFHQVIAEMSGNEPFLVMLDSIGGVLPSFASRRWGFPADRLRRCSTTKSILEAIERGDAAVATPPPRRRFHRRWPAAQANKEPVTAKGYWTVQSEIYDMQCQAAPAARKYLR